MTRPAVIHINVEGSPPPVDGSQPLAGRDELVCRAEACEIAAKLAYDPKTARRTLFLALQIYDGLMAPLGAGGDQ